MAGERLIVVSSPTKSRRVASCVLALLMAGLGVMSGPALADPDADVKEAWERFYQGDVVTAMKLLRGPADAGHAPSQVLLAFILDKSELDAEAVAYYQKAVAQGNADAQFELGVLYAAGEGVGKDNSEALRLVGLAAAQGHAAATNTLAEAYLSGRMGIDAAAAESPAALAAVEKAARNNLLPAVDAMAAAYASGRWGLLPDPEKAAQYRKQASSLRGSPSDGQRRGRR